LNHLLHGFALIGDFGFWEAIFYGLVEEGAFGGGGEEGLVELGGDVVKMVSGAVGLELDG
jgi:hypothetical protein